MTIARSRQQVGWAERSEAQRYTADCNSPSSPALLPRGEKGANHGRPGTHRFDEHSGIGYSCHPSLIQLLLAFQIRKMPGDLATPRLEASDPGG